MFFFYICDANKTESHILGDKEGVFKVAYAFLHATIYGPFLSYCDVESTGLVELGQQDPQYCGVWLRGQREATL